MEKLFITLLLLFPVIVNATCLRDENSCIKEDSVLNDGSVDYSLSSANETSRLYGVSIGHRRAKLFDVETKYSFLGSYQDQIGGLSRVTDISVSGIRFFDPTSSLDVFGKLGVAYTLVSAQVPTTRADVTYGLGLDFHVSRDWVLRYDFDLYKASFPQAENVSTNILSIQSTY